MIASILIFGFIFSPEFISAKTLSRSLDYQNQTQRVFLEENEAISFLAIGDWGSRRDHQDEVRNNIVKQHCTGIDLSVQTKLYKVSEVGE